MITTLAANDFGDDLGDGVAGPVGLLIIVLLVVALVLLMRSMNKHLRRVPASFDDLKGPAASSGTGPAARDAAPISGPPAMQRDTEGSTTADAEPSDLKREPGGG